jgi:hypothetical protein
MGRRARARERAAAAAAEHAVPPKELPGRRLLRWFNPIKRGTRAKARFAALVFAVLTLALAGAAWANQRPSLYRPAVLLGILAVLWGVRSAAMPEDPKP